MKKSLFLLISCFTTCITCHAQENTNLYESPISEVLEEIDFSLPIFNILATKDQNILSAKKRKLYWACSICYYHENPINVDFCRCCGNRKTTRD